MPKNAPGSRGKAKHAMPGGQSMMHSPAEMESMMASMKPRRAAMRSMMHSPARDTQAFDDTFLGNAAVPRRALTTGNPGSKSVPSARGVPKGVQQSDGTGNLRATVQTIMAGLRPSSPSGTGTRWPAGVTQYTDDEV